MGIYRCSRCYKEFDRKSNYINHLNKKFICKKSLHKTSQKLRTKCEVNKYSSIDKFIKKIYECEYCQKHFTRDSTLKRHIECYCKLKPVKEQIGKIFEQVNVLENQVEKFKDKIKDLEKDNKNYKHLLNVHRNKINTQNIDNSKNSHNNINIHINAFGSENLSRITNDDYQAIMKLACKSIPELIKCVHFYKGNEDNRNILLSNINGGYILICDGTNWNMRDKKKIVNDLYEKNSVLLEEKYEELTGRLDTRVERSFSKYLEKKDDARIVSNIKKDIVSVLYDNRNKSMAIKNGYIINDKEDCDFIKRLLMGRKIEIKSNKYDYEDSLIVFNSKLDERFRESIKCF